MGVPKPKSKSGKKKPARPPQQLTAEEHFENAEMAFTMENFDQAAKSFRRALDMEPENIEYLEGYGSFLAETGQREEAVVVLQRAAAAQPDEGFEKFMYLGQLVEDPAEAESNVRKGVSILRAYLQQHAQEPAPAEGSEEAEEQAMEKEHLDATLASCLCALAEALLHKAQAAGEGALAGVEGEVESTLNEARGLSPDSPEPLQALASLRQQQGKDEEALQVLRQSMALWFKPAPEESDEEAEEEGGEGKPAAGGSAKKKKAEAEEEDLGSSDSDDDEMEFDSDDDELPSYEFRFETAKLLLELDESVEAASQVLEGLLDENDQDPNVWLLLAMCCQGGGDEEGALGAVEEGIEVCKRLGLPKEDDTYAGLEALQEGLQTLLKEAAKQGGKEEK
ncbi:UPF0661 TPR repeat-containing -like [Chlorella sorokiniana]|uniref:UPF0661 TPR repeat-containing-like n=1 Tax=Chlorella sorokiniana TaxID=3076 RepID=A0A2P6TFD0_CHLSO|nr:UPF0661 TPR repeat-containing -like [Chlorella sorokiniana]|eukprot:PRW32682.1 UPF0661 TPR repeat-containing -like [Chlorella sorokiniana]